jgi:hypothetical protein
LEEQIRTLGNRGTGRQLHPSRLHRLIKFPRYFINGRRSSFTRIRSPFKVKANSGTLLPSAQVRKKLYSLAERLSDVRLNGLAFGQLGEGIFQLDCKFLPVLRQFQKRSSQLWSVGSYGQFGAARGVSTAFYGITWHWLHS